MPIFVVPKLLLLLNGQPGRPEIVEDAFLLLVEDIEKKQTAFDKFKSRAVVAILLSLAASIGAVGPEVISLGIKTYIEEVKQSAQP